MAEQEKPDVKEEAEKKENEEAKVAEKKPQEPEKGQFTLDGSPVAENTGIPGLGIDFNCGMRVRVPNEEGWGIQAIDMETDYTLNIVSIPAGNMAASDKKYFIPWKIKVSHNGECVHEHIYDAAGKDVTLEMCSEALGDNLAFIPYARVFKEKHHCRKVYVRTTKIMKEFLSYSYPDLEFIERGTYPEGVYATYYLGNFYPSTSRSLQKYSWHMTGLQGCAHTILGLPDEEVRPELLPTKKERTIKEPYVCIAAQASAQCKYWNNPAGWMETIKFLKQEGYRVLCIDKDLFYGNGDVKNSIPWGAEDFTGNIPLQERVNVLNHADFFIGLSSGLAWLAWGTGVPVVLVSGFTSPHNEFKTPYRIINHNVCNSCFNDGQKDFDMKRFDTCPKHQDDPVNRFICTKAISSGQVIRAIQRLMKDYELDPKAGKTRT